MGPLSHRFGGSSGSHRDRNRHEERTFRPALAVRGNRDSNGMHEMGSVPEECVTFCRGVPEVDRDRVSEGSAFPREYAQGLAGAAGGEVTLFHQGHGKTPKRSVRATEIPAMPPPTTIKSNFWDANA